MPDAEDLISKRVSRLLFMRLCYYSGMAIKDRRATCGECLSACEALEKGVSPDEVAKVLEVSRSSIFEWQKIPVTRADALRTKKNRGPESKLSPDHSHRSLAAAKWPRIAATAEI